MEEAGAGDRTIRDFGDQWTRYVDNAGYYGSLELLQDVCGPLLDLNVLHGARVADIGSGTGRIAVMLAAAHAAHVTAVEPSDAFEVLRRNTAHISDRVTLLHTTGDRLPAGLDLDWVFSIGVIHHVPEPENVLRAAYAALKPGGGLLIWVYGSEGNERYLRVARPVRFVTTRLPHAMLAMLSLGLAWIASGYLAAARRLSLPVSPYLESVFSKLSYANRQLVVYDQLRPRYSRYYAESEVRALLVRCGFDRVRTYHRHGYSWTAIGHRPDEADGPPGRMRHG